MVLNIEKLKEKNKLAKSLVERGIAPSFEEAVARIDDEGLVHNAGKLSTANTPLENLKKRAFDQVRENELREIEKEEVQQQREETAKIVASDPKVLERLEKIERFLGDFKTFFDKYRTLNDSNLKELDSKLKSLRADLSNSTPAPKLHQQTLREPHPRQPELKRKPEAEGSDTSRASFDTSEFAVEKIFSNSHGKLTKKKPC